MSHQLTARDRQILEFIDRYRIGTPELLKAVCFEPESRIQNVNRVLLRLERQGLLQRITLDRGFFYVTLTRSGQRFLGQQPRTHRSLTEQTLPVLLAVATYCVERKRQRLTADEYRQHFPELWRPGMRASQYVLSQAENKLRLELLLVDRGGSAHRVQSRVRRQIHQRRGLTAFSALMQAGRFQITILVGTGPQQEKIERRLNRYDWSPVKVVTCVIPELADLLLLRSR
ncbi:MAG: hypothetical protein KDA65_13495 [Planctomycetaceae bacterium]|nr:hypothetical protein [Planctomycetaceae bacterium]